MKNGTPGTSVIGEGRLGSGFVPRAYADTVHGHYDPERGGHAELRLANGHGARDVSPSAAQEAAASAGKDPDAARRQVITDLFVRVRNGIVLAHAQDGLTVVAHDDTLHIKPALVALHQQLPRQRLLSLHASPAGDHAIDGCEMLGFAPDPFPLTAIGHYGQRSPFALVNSPSRQELFVVATHNALCNAPRSHAANPSAGDVVEGLGELGPCFQFGFSSQPLALAQRRRIFGPLGRLAGGPFTPGVGNLDDALKAAARATIQAHQPAAFTTAEPFDATTPHFVLYLCPFAPGGETFAEFVERQSVWLGAHFPSADGVFVSANGVAPLDGEGERFLQVSVLAPMAGPAREEG